MTARLPVSQPEHSPSWHAELHLGFARQGERTVLRENRHRGPLRVQKALYPEGNAICQAIVLHPPSGIAGGDHLAISSEVGAGAHAQLTTPGAGKWYRSCGAEASQSIAFTVAEGATRSTPKNCQKRNDPTSRRPSPSLAPATKPNIHVSSDRKTMSKQALRVGIGGPVGSGKTVLTLALCQALREQVDMAVVTNDIYTAEDAKFLVNHSALAPERIIGVETGGSPHTAIREDASINLEAIDRLQRAFPDVELILVESGCDNLAATFSPELSDLTLYVIDVAAGEKIPRKGGPRITKSDPLIINKIDLAPMVGASLEVMAHDAKVQRGERPFVFSNLKTGEGLEQIVAFIRERRMLG